jgi:hypothetical protein
MEETISNLRKNTGSVSGNLRGMPIGKDSAIEVPLCDAARIRGLITQIHKSKTGINAGLKFGTEAVYDINGNITGILVWREA